MVAKCPMCCKMMIKAERALRLGDDGGCETTNKYLLDKLCDLLQVQ